MPLELISSTASASFDDNLVLLAPHVQPKQPLYALLRRGEPAIQEQEARAGASAERAAEEALAH